MHAQGVIHQDIKPANIMLTSRKQVKVGDFGVSRISNAETTTAFATAGTPAYMSPEQCRGEPVDGRSDLFSAGTTLYEMLAGERAFDGRNVTEVAHRVQNVGLPLLPAELRSQLPRLQLVLERATGKHPADRFDSAADMAEALRQVLANRGDDVTRVQAAGVAGNTPTLRVGTPSSPPGPPIDRAMMAAVEAKLMQHVGPIAPVLLRTAINRSRSLEELCAELVRSVGNEAERDRFRHELEIEMNMARAPAPRDPSLPRGLDEDDPLQAEMQRAQAALTEFVGPIARVLTRKAAAQSASIDQLWQTLAQHIDAPAERAAFLRKRQG